MANSTFASLFQSAVTDASLVTYTAEQMSSAFDSATLHQFPLITTKVNALLKDVLKDGLFFAPVVANVTATAEQTLVSGRHRAEIARIICEQYGIAATGKVVLRTPENEGALQPIEYEMRVSEISVPDMVTAVKLIVAANGSRTMTAPEKAKCKISMGAATPTVLAQSKLANLLLGGVAEYDMNVGDDDKINLTQVTALSMIQACTARVKTLIYGNDEQLEEFTNELVQHLATSELPPNLARDFRPIVASLLDMVVATEYDANGEEVEVTYASVVGKSITKPVAKKAATKVTVKDESIAHFN